MTVWSDLEGGGDEAAQRKNKSQWWWQIRLNYSDQFPVSLYCLLGAANYKKEEHGLNTVFTLTALLHMHLTHIQELYIIHSPHASL